LDEVSIAGENPERLPVENSLPEKSTSRGSERLPAENPADDGDCWWDEPESRPLLEAGKTGKTGKTKTGKSKRACRLPEDWQPSISEAIRLGLPEGQVGFEIDRFRDYWRAKSKDAARSDWPATWRNWVRGEVQKIRQREENRKFYAESRGKNQPHKSQNMRQILGEWVNGSDLTPGGTYTWDEMYPPEIYDTVIGFAEGT